MLSSPILPHIIRSPSVASRELAPPQLFKFQAHSFEYLYRAWLEAEGKLDKPRRFRQFRDLCNRGGFPLALYDGEL